MYCTPTLRSWLDATLLAASRRSKEGFFSRRPRLTPRPQQLSSPVALSQPGIIVSSDITYDPARPDAIHQVVRNVAHALQSVLKHKSCKTLVNVVFVDHCTQDRSPRLNDLILAARLFVEGRYPTERLWIEANALALRRIPVNMCAVHSRPHCALDSLKACHRVLTTLSCLARLMTLQACLILRPESTRVPARCGGSVTIRLHSA
jgi:hypothetical protein